MQLTVTHNAAYAEQAIASLSGKVNLLELQQVRRDHLPCVVVRLTPLAELERRAAELCREQPHYAEEAAFVVYDEKLRRQRLATSPLKIAL